MKKGRVRSHYVVNTGHYFSSSEYSSQCSNEWIGKTTKEYAQINSVIWKPLLRFWKSTEMVLFCCSWHTNFRLETNRRTQNRIKQWFWVQKQYINLNPRVGANSGYSGYTSRGSISTWLYVHLKYFWSIGRIGWRPPSCVSGQTPAEKVKSKK